MFHDFRRSLVAAALAGISPLALIAITAPAMAQEATRSFDIAAQPLSGALLEYSQQSGILVVVAPDRIAGKQAAAVKGTMAPTTALNRLLDGTGLQAVRQPDGGYTLAEVHTSQSGEYDAGQGPAASAGAEGEDREIVVTGTLIRGAAPAGANLIVLDRAELDKTGRGTLAEAIQTAPQVHGSGANDTTFRTGTSGNQFNRGAVGASSINLRGLGVEETLTLVNGKRLAPGGYFGTVADVSVIPFAAVKRVEVLADGASATYGADAMAGVVNIILNDRFEGAETRVRAGLETRSGQPNFQASQMFGWSFDRGSLLVAGEYYRQDSIGAEGRPYAASADLRPLGGSDHRAYYCSPGNIVIPSPAELVGAIPTIPAGGMLSPDQILRGQSNRCNQIEGIAMVPGQERGGLFTSGSYQANDRLQFSADVMVSRRTTSYSELAGIDNLLIPATNAYRQLYGFSGAEFPFDQPLYIQYAFDQAATGASRSGTWSVLVNAGAEYQLGKDWSAALHGSYGWYRDKLLQSHRDRRAASAGGHSAHALASSDLATAFNPFGGPGANDPDLVARFFVPYVSLQESSYRTATLSLNGSLFNLPGGAVRMALGGEFRNETFDALSFYRYPGNAEDPSASALSSERDVAAGYAELYLPFVSERNAVPGIRQLSASASGRYDHYSDFGGAFNFKLGMSWVPMGGIRLKGTIGSSFKSPPLRSLYSPVNASFHSLPLSSGGPDFNGDGQTGMLQLTGGNPDLGPEKGTTWTAGIEATPSLLSPLRLHATYFNIKFRDRFGGISGVADVFANPDAYRGLTYFPSPTQAEIARRLAFADTVSSTPLPGAVDVIIDSRTTNISRQSISGIDAGARYNWDAWGGSLALTGDLSYLIRYESQLAASVTKTSLLGDVGLPPHWRARGGIGWGNDRISLNGHINYTGSYKNRQADQPVASYTTVDLSLQAKIGGAMRQLAGDGLTLAFFVTNLFDKAPPFVDDVSGFGYDGANADPVGRRIAVQLTKNW